MTDATREMAGERENMKPDKRLKPTSITKKCIHRMGFCVDGFYRCQKCRKSPRTILREKRTIKVHK